MSGDSLKIGSMQSPVLWILVGFPTGDDEVLDIKKPPQEISHFSRVKSVHGIWKLLRSVCIYDGFCRKMFSVN